MRITKILVVLTLGLVTPAWGHDNPFSIEEQLIIITNQDEDVDCKLASVAARHSESTKKIDYRGLYLSYGRRCIDRYRGEDDENTSRWHTN